LDTQGFPIAEGEANYNVARSSRGGASLVTPPQQADQMVPDSTMIDGALADSRGIWLLSFDELYLWMPANQVTQVLPGQGDRGLAGPCQ
jgi:hypothetical protein